MGTPELPRQRRPVVAVTRSSLPSSGVDRLREHTDALLAVYASVDRAFFEASPNQKIVALPHAGFDSVDVGAARDHGVIVTHTPNVLFETTADTTFALILLAR